MGGLRPGARTQPVALHSLPGIFHRLPAGLTEVTRAWGAWSGPGLPSGLRTPAPSTSESVAPLQPSAAGPSPVSRATFYHTRPVVSPSGASGRMVYSDSPFLLVV